MTFFQKIAGILLLLPGVAMAQLNESDTARFQVKAGVNGLRQTGNVDLGIVRSRMDLVFRIGNSWVFKTQNNTLYQEFSSRKADNDLNSRNYLYYKPQQRVYPFAMAYVQANYRLRMDSRFFTGAGATLQIIRQTHHHLRFSASVVYEETRYATASFNEAYYQKPVIALWRPTLYLAGAHAFADGKIRLSYNAYWQPGLDPVSNQRFQGELGLEFLVWKGLSLTTQYWRTFEEVVPVKIKENDSIFTAGLAYSFKK